MIFVSGRKGGKSGVITAFIRDNGIGGNLYDEYIPNIWFLNAVIAEWERKRIRFYGIYHTHFSGGYDLSNADKAYIRDIMRRAPCRRLYFPVIPGNERMVAHYAELRKDGLVFSKEDISFVK